MIAANPNPHRRLRKVTEQPVLTVRAGQAILDYFQSVRARIAALARIVLPILLGTILKLLIIYPGLLARWVALSLLDDADSLHTPYCLKSRIGPVTAVTSSRDRRHGNVCPRSEYWHWNGGCDA